MAGFCMLYSTLQSDIKYYFQTKYSSVKKKEVQYFRELDFFCLDFSSMVIKKLYINNQFYSFSPALQKVEQLFWCLFLL